MSDIQLTTLKCLRCGHTWIPRKKRYPRGDYPTTCPQCQSWYWDAPFLADSHSEAKQLMNEAHGHA